MNQFTSFLAHFKSLSAAGYLFYGLAAVTLISAISVVTARNPIHSVLALIFTFFCLTGHYMLLNAQFLAIVNIIVYAGAIMVLFLFAIMFLNLKQDDQESKTTVTKTAAVIVGGVLMVLLLSILRATPAGTYDINTFDSQTGLVERLGMVLYSDYILPFELASILFLIAMVGSVLLGKREAGDPHF